MTLKKKYIKLRSCKRARINNRESEKQQQEGIIQTFVGESFTESSGIDFLKRSLWQQGSVSLRENEVCWVGWSRGDGLCVTESSYISKPLLLTYSSASRFSPMMIPASWINLLILPASLAQISTISVHILQDLCFSINNLLTYDANITECRKIK